MIDTIFNSIQKLFYHKESEFSTRRHEIITSRENPQSDTIFVDCLFDSIEASQNNGGAICVDKPINLTIKKTKFSQCSSVREGGSLYISGAHASLFCLAIYRSHTRTNNENIGGNAYSMLTLNLK